MRGNRDWETAHSGNIKCTNIFIIEVSEGEEREKKAENFLEKMIADKCPNLGKETDIQIQKAKRVPNKTNPNRSTPRH